jgi:RimJ/RimL family protein N-acetyltransferase
MSELPAVSLRARTAADLDVLFSIAADLDTWEERNPSAPAPLTRERFDARLAATTDSNTSGDTVNFVIDVDGAAVGSASLFGYDSFARHAEAGISLVREARGRGIGTAAIVQLVEFGFVRRNLRRIHLQAIASNTGAIRAYEKAGFVIEGRQRQHAWVRGTYEDIVLMGMLRSEQPSPADQAATGISATKLRPSGPSRSPAQRPA